MRYQQQRYSRLIPGEKKKKQSRKQFKAGEDSWNRSVPSRAGGKREVGTDSSVSGREMGGLTTQGPQGWLRLGAELRVLEKTSLQ